MTSQLHALYLLLAAATLSSCRPASSEPTEPSKVARIGVFFPNGGASGDNTVHATITIQGMGKVLSRSCQSLNTTLSGTYDAIVPTDGTGLAVLRLAKNLAMWRGAGCTVPAASTEFISANFTAVTTIVVTAELAATAASCGDYCFGGPRPGTCEEHCRTFSVIHTAEPLNESQITTYEGTGEIAGSVYLNQLR